MKLKTGTEYSLIYENAPFPYIGVLQAIDIETASLVFIISGKEVAIPLLDIQSKKIGIEAKPCKEDGQADHTVHAISSATQKLMANTRH
jgi:hypothetical protein